MKHLKLIFLSLIGLIFFMGDMHMSEAGGRGRRYIEDDTNDEEVRCQREKLKKKQLGEKYIEPKICDPKVPRSQQRNCIAHDCIDRGQTKK